MWIPGEQGITRVPSTEPIGLHRELGRDATPLKDMCVKTQVGCRVPTTEETEQLMTDQADVERAVDEAHRKFQFEVASATHRLFRLLTATELLRSKAGSSQMSHGTPVIPPSYLDVFVNLVDPNEVEDPLARHGSVEQSAYLAWITEVVSVNERSRSALQAAFRPLASDAIRPETAVLGDLNHIRNDLLHNGRIASQDHTGRCEVLRWFELDDRIVLETKHVFDFLNQLGIYGASFFLESGEGVPLVSFSWMFTNALARQPVPRVISVRPVVAAHRETGQDHRGLSLVYDNGVHIWCDLGEGEPVEHVELRSDGAIVAVPEMDEIDALALYQESSIERLTRPARQSDLHSPWGPPSRIRRDET